MVQKTTVRYSTTDAVVLGGLGLAAGAALGWFAPEVARFAATWDWLPFTGPLEVLGRITTSGGGVMHVVITLVLAVLGLLGGIALLDETAVEIDDRSITVRRKAETSRFARDQVAEVELVRRSLGRSTLSLRDGRDADLVRAELDLAADRVRAGLERHGWTVVTLGR